MNRARVALFVPLLLLSACASTSTDALRTPAAFAYERAESGVVDDAPLPYGDKLVRSYALRLSVAAPDSAAVHLAARAETLGGYLTDRRDLVLTYRIPAARTAAFLAHAATLGRVSEQRVTTEDLTAQYADVAARIESLTALRLRYLALLERAATVTDLLAVEQELARVNLELDQLQGNNRRIDDRVALDTVRIRLHEQVKLGPLGAIFTGLYRGIKWLFVRG